jgi:signal transduction histidine kinase
MKDDNTCKYIQIKVTSLNRQDKNSLMLQFVNCSKDILYDREKS